MARKRGGIAGLYDKSKGFLKVAAPIGLSFIPGVGIPLAAAAGAAMGADTEGKGYFSGFNVGGAIKGGLEGYGLAKGTQSIAGGVKNLLAPKTPDISGAMNRASSMIGQANQQIAANPAFGGSAVGAGGYGGVGSMPGIGFGLGNQPPIPDITPDRAMQMGRLPMMDQTASAVPNVALPLERGPGWLGSMFSSAGRALKNPEVAKFAIQGGLQQLPSAESRALQEKTQVEADRLKLEQQRFEEEKRQIALEERRKSLMAQLLIPYAQENFAQYFGPRR